jgi:hypothetical protein
MSAPSFWNEGNKSGHRNELQNAARFRLSRRNPVIEQDQLTK